MEKPISSATERVRAQPTTANNNNQRKRNSSGNIGNSGRVVPLKEAVNKKKEVAVSRESTEN